MKTKTTENLLRITVHLGCIVPLLWLSWAIPNHLLGGDPVKELVHYFGMGAIRLVILTLTVSPLAKQLKVPVALKLRRAIGLWAATWATLHIICWAWLDQGLSWPLIMEEVLQRNYIILGFVGWIILLILAFTSIPSLVKKLGRRWKPIHRWVYIAAIMVCIHFWWSLKSGWVEPAIYCLFVLALLALRKQITPIWAIPMFKPSYRTQKSK